MSNISNISKQLHTIIQSAELWPPSPSVVGPLLGALAISTLILSATRRSPPNEPPMVPYLIPWIGNSISLLWDPKRFFTKANAKYGEMYTIVHFGRKFVVVSGKSLVTEVFKAGEEYISFRAASNEIIPATRLFKLSYAHKHVPDFRDGPVAPTIRNHLKPNQLEVFQSQLMEGTKSALEKEIGPNGGRWDKPTDKMQHFVARISCLCFAGEEIGRDEALITVMAEFTNRMVLAGVIAGYFPGWLGDIIIKRTCSLTSALDVIYDNAKPMLDRRALRREQQPDWEPPQDMLQWIQETPLNNGGVRKTADTAMLLAMVGLVSIHTTSMFSLFALNELAVRPDIVAVLRADIAKATADNGGVLTPELVDKLPRLDSFLRETLRLGVDVLGHRHMAVQDYAFKNGMIVRKGTLVVVPTLAVHSDPEIQPEDSNKNLDEFDAFRYANIPSKKSYSASPAYITFGEGPHTCPGRFFAAQEIKYLLAAILMNYDVKTTSKKRAPNKYEMGMSTFPPDCPLIFEPIGTKQA